MTGKFTFFTTASVDELALLLSPVMCAPVAAVLHIPCSQHLEQMTASLHSLQLGCVILAFSNIVAVQSRQATQNDMLLPSTVVLGIVTRSCNHSMSVPSLCIAHTSTNTVVLYLCFTMVLHMR